MFDAMKDKDRTGVDNPVDYKITYNGLNTRPVTESDENSRRKTEQSRRCC